MKTNVVLTVCLLVLGATVALAKNDDDRSFLSLRFRSGEHELNLAPTGELTVDRAGTRIAGKATEGELEALLAGALSNDEHAALEERMRHVTIINLARGRPFTIDVKKGTLHHLKYRGYGNIMDDRALQHLDAVLLGIVDRVTEGGVYGAKSVALEGTVVMAERATGYQARAVRTANGAVYFIEGEFTSARAEKILAVGSKVVVNGIVDDRSFDQTRPLDLVKIVTLTRPPELAPAKTVGITGALGR